MQELSELHKKGNTIIMVTHNPNLTSYASRVINMLDGKIASDRRITVKVSSREAVEITLNQHRKEVQNTKQSETLATKRTKKAAKKAKKNYRKMS